MNIEDVLAEVATELDWMQPSPVFIGGATIGLYLDAFGRAQLRPTRDVDLIAPAATTTMGWFDLEAQLRTRGWSPDREGPICRYRSPLGHTVDLLAVCPAVQGFAGRWFEGAVAHARERRLPQGVTVRLPDVAWLLACKIEAFGDRGRADPLLSQDFEDLVALLDGCGEVADSIARAPLDVQVYVRTWCGDVLSDRRLLEAADGHLPRGPDDEGRRGRLRARLQGIR